MTRRAAFLAGVAVGFAAVLTPTLLVVIDESRAAKRSLTQGDAR